MCHYQTNIIKGMGQGNLMIFIICFIVKQNIHWVTSTSPQLERVHAIVNDTHRRQLRK